MISRCTESALERADLFRVQNEVLECGSFLHVQFKKGGTLEGFLTGQKCGGDGDQFYGAIRVSGCDDYIDMLTIAHISAVVAPQHLL